MQIRATANKDDFGKCGCGRSPDGKCRGWHGLTEEQYRDALEKYEKSRLGSTDGDENND
jgi:hypothetical protein